MKTRIIGVVIAVGVAVVAATGIVHATPQRVDSGDTTTLSKSQTVDSAYYAYGNTIVISGTVNGDVYCAGQSVTIDGTINGDVFCAGQTVKVSGTVAGDVRVAAQQLDLSGAVSGSATIFGQVVTLDSAAKIGRDLNGASQTVTIDGQVQRDVAIGANTLTVNGTIGRNVTSSVSNLKTNVGSKIGGGLYYTSENTAELANGTVAGEVVRTEPQPTQQVDTAEYARGAAIYFFLAMLLIAMVLIIAVPQAMDRITANGLQRFGMSLLVGFFVLIGVPILAALVALTVFGIPLAIIIMLVWALLIALSGPVFGYYIGRLVLRRAQLNSVLVMLFGSTVLILSYFVEVLNFFTILAALVVGTGMIVLQLTTHYQRPSYTTNEGGEIK